MGVRDDGTPDRRHVERKTRAEVTAAVAELEKQRDAKTVRKPGKAWTVKAWLTHWIENVASLAVNDNDNTMVGYGVAVRKHLNPGLGAHRLDRLKPEHIEVFYAKMQANGSKPATAHQVHRIFRAALNEAVRRGHLGKNPVLLAKAPTTGDHEAESYTVQEVQRLLRAADRHRDSAKSTPRNSPRAELADGCSAGESLNHSGTRPGRWEREAPCRARWDGHRAGVRMGSRGSWGLQRDCHTPFMKQGPGRAGRTTNVPGRRGLLTGVKPQCGPYAGPHGSPGTAWCRCRR